jgi:hypothetical protein
MVTFEKAPPEALQLLPVPIRELGLRLESTHLAPLIEQLYSELQNAGLRHFRPLCYLSDEWGCPSGQPVIGIPWYLADPRAKELENALNDVENEREVMMYLRHEAGHAFNYAYELYKTDMWRVVFGPFRRPYRDDYAFVPFSRDYVRHIAGWYAQKHPDEDFAETFAVWLDPSSQWRRRYAGWSAFRKLEYVDDIVKQVGDLPPQRPAGETDITVEEMEQTVADFYEEALKDETPNVAGLALDTDLTDIFMTPESKRDDVEYRAARELLAEHRRDIADKVNYWTGVRRTLVRTLLLAIERRAEELELVAEVSRTRSHMIDLTVYVATLAMTFLTGARPLRHRK